MTFTINLVNEIACNYFQHSRETNWWTKQNEKYTLIFDAEFDGSLASFSLGLAGEISIRDIDFGNISTAHLFGLDELIIFAWYEVNAKRYTRTLDLGANIGVHSMLMSKFGYEVTAYEPDPHHAEFFEQTMRDNHIQRYELRRKAIGTSFEKASFTRVLGNTTGSHLSGAKKNPYGDLEIFDVEVDSFREIILEGFDFVKMDVEGFELELISSLNSSDFDSMEIMIEIGSSENAFGMFNQLNRLGVNAFSQKINWEKVTKLDDLPTSHKEGSLFLTNSPLMNWNQ